MSDNGQPETTPDAPILNAQGIVKRFGATCPVNHVDLALYPGRCLGLLGPNGAGKTTTMEILQGLTPPDAGTVSFMGAPITQGFANQVGIMFQSTALPDKIKVHEVLSLFAALHTVVWPLPSLIELCALGALLDRQPSELSGGERQRLLLAIALVNRPRILFLDEPTAGLDPRARRDIWQVLRQLLDDGSSVLLTTHYMDEAQFLCDDLAIMSQGKIIHRGQTQALLHAFSEIRVIELPAYLETQLPKEISYTLERGVLAISCEDVEMVLAKLSNAGLPLRGLTIRGKTLEDLFLSFKAGER